MLPTLILFQKVALVGGLVHSMVPGAKPEVATILIDHGQIEAIGPDVKVPADAKTIPIQGKHVIPGLVDGMVNFDADHDRLYISCGVTLVREIGAELSQMLAERDSQARDRNPGPALWIAGAILDGAQPATLSAVVMGTREEAVDKASRLIHPPAGEPTDYFSFYKGISKDAWSAVIELAHKEPTPVQVWGTLPVGATFEDALKAGQDGIFYLDSLLPAGKTWKDVTEAELEAIAKRAGESKIAVTPTIGLYASRLLPPPTDRPELKYLGPIQVAQWLADDKQRHALFDGKPELVAEGLAQLKKQLGLVKALHEHKVTLVPGSGCGMAPWVFPGEALLDELSLWTGKSVGMSQSEALMLATRGAATRIGALRKRGTLEKDKSADLVVTSDDPEQSLATLRTPDYVVVRGRVLSAHDIKVLLDGEKDNPGLKQRQQQLQALAFNKLELPAPKQPAGEVVLSGLVETRYQGQRISGERFVVARLSDGSLNYAGRMLTFGSATTSDTDCESLQRIQDGRLVELSVTVTSGNFDFALGAIKNPSRVILVKGTLAGGTLNIERFVNGVFNDMPRIRENAAFLEYGSVLTDLILGQSVKPGQFTALFLQDFEFASSEKWEMHVDPSSGEHLLRGPIGDRVVSFEIDGAPKLSVRRGGRSELVRTLLEHTPVKNGLPVPPKQNPPAEKPVSKPK